MKNGLRGIAALCLMGTVVLTSMAAAPDLTAPGVIASTDKTFTYNLGSTGLRGWIYIGGGTPYDGTLTVESRQILVTVASTPGSAVMAVDDVILGAMAGSSGDVPVFTNDARKALGAAIGDAEKTGAGTLRVKRWRAGVANDVNISMAIMGDYTATAPYSCPKSALILSNACNKLVSQLLADANFLTVDYAGAINGLALLAGVVPGDPNYATVETRLQTFARDCATSVRSYPLPTWHLGYIGLFLSEYYLLTSDSQVVSGLNDYIVTLAQMQSRYGTYGHGGSLRKDDGSLHGTVPPYGPVNGCSVPANLAIVMGKKALVAAGQALDPEIDPAVQRGSSFYGWYANKGGIPYGEHEPNFNNHSSAGKDAMCAIMFAIQDGHSAETEFFTRYALAGFNGLEYAHAGGQNFAFLWNALGANMGGELAMAEYLKQIRWHHELVRRTDGSFAFEGQEQFGAGSTLDGTYLGESRGYDFQTTASYILTYSLPLKRLYITGKNANPTNTLDAAKVANAIAAATYSLDCTNTNNYPVSRLITGLSAFDPMVRNVAAIELAKRSLSAGELTTLRGMVTGTDANGRMGACQALGLLKDVTALPSIVERLDKTSETNSWVRSKAANALRQYASADAGGYRDAALTAFAANATNPEVIDWDDPLQRANTQLSFCLFGGWDETIVAVPPFDTIRAPKNLLYPALKAGLKQPDSLPRSGVATFCKNDLELQDVQALALDIFEVITTKSQADTMWSKDPQLAGLELLMIHNCAEALPIGLSLMDFKEGWGHGAAAFLSSVLDTLVTFGDSARWIMPFLYEDINTLLPVLDPVDYNPTVPKILSTISTIDSAITSPSGLVYLLPLASNQVVVTTGAKAITLAGTSPRSAVTFTNVTVPAHGTLTGTAPDLTYTPNVGYTGPDHFTFQVVDNLTTSAPGTVSILVGTAGAGLKGEYFDNMDFTSLKLTRTDAQVAFDWGAGSPDALLGADTFSVRWSGVLLVPETGSYTFSTLNSDGVRLYINGVPVINQFTDQDINWNDSTPLALTEGQWVDIQMDYYENTGSAVAKLKWTGPLFAGVNGDIIGSQWLFDGTGMNRAPYAFPQSLTLLKNVSQPITLTGSAGTLTYSVVTPPSHGTLSNTAPNLVYTPFADYIGLDSFTFKVNNGTTDSVPATVSLDVIPANTFSVNFYVGPEWPYGGLTTDEQKANLFVYPGMYAGLTDWFTHSWQNYLVPWAPSGPQPPVTLTSNRGSPATFIFKNCRNGYTYDGPRTTLLGDGNGNLMDGHVNSTLDGPYLFDMEVTDIPFAVYDVIFYIGANAGQYGDGTGVITFNGGAERAFTLKPGAFDGTFTEMVDATTAGNYIIFSGVTGSSFTAQTWGTGPGGFNHLGPCGFQIREVIFFPQAITFGALTPKTYGDPPFSLTATASSGLTVSYTSSDTNVATVAGSTVTIRKAGTTVITASQAGSVGYYAATHVLQTLTVNPRPVVLSGTRTYDGTTAAVVASLSITNKVGTDDVTLSGSAALSNKNVGVQMIFGDTAYATPLRVQSATGNTGSSASAAFELTLAAVPANGNTLVAVISTRGSLLSRVTSITQTGATWSRASQAANNGTTTEIWYAPNVSGAGTGMTINQATLFSAAVVTEYSGLLTASPLDQTANATANSNSASTGTTPSTTQENELWIGGIGLRSSDYTLGTPNNAFNAVANASSGSSTATDNARTYFLEKSVTATGPASSGGTVSNSSRWSGAIATFKAVPPSIVLNGADAANYTLTGMSGTMTITPKALTLSGASAANKIYDATTNVTLNGGALLTAEAPGAGTPSDGKPYTSDEVNVSVSGTFDTKDTGVNKAVTSTSTLTGLHAGNYTLTQPSGLTATITPKALNVESAAIASKAYDAATNATFSAGGLQSAETPGTGSTADGKPYDSDTVGVSLSGFFASKNVAAGIAVTSVSSLTGAQAGNYRLTQPLDLTGTITNAVLIVTADNQSKAYGQTLAFASGSTLFTTGGLQGGETIGTVTLACDGGISGAVAGTYPITPSAATGGTFNPANYAVSYFDGTLTVNPAAQNITFGALVTKTYGDIPFALSATASSGLPVSYSSSDTHVATVVSNLVTVLNVGTTTITATQAGNASYGAATPVQQALLVNPATQTITFSALASKTYGDAPFALTATASSGLEVSYSSSDTNVATVANNLVTILNVGATTITATQAGSTNYTEATPVPQTLTVNKATPVVTWNAPGGIVYGTALSALQLNATAGGVAGTFVYTPPAGEILPVGAHLLSVQFTPADTGTYTTPAATQVPITVGDSYLEEDFENDWADNALARTTNGWTSSVDDQSSITNPAVGMAPLPRGGLFPILYNHRDQRRLLNLKTKTDALRTPTLAASFAALAVHVDMMVRLIVFETNPSSLTNNLDQKAAIFLLASGAATNLVVYHGQKAADGFAAPLVTPLADKIDPDTWYRLTVTFDATTNNAGAEAFCVRINGKPLVSDAAYQNTWKTRIFSPTDHSPDGGMWFLSASRREGASGSNLNCFTAVTFEGIGDVDDLVVTPILPTFSLGTLFRFTFNP